MATRIGVAQVDITPTASVWLTGYGDRDHKSEGVYQALRAGAVAISTAAEELVIITADVIGYGPAYSAEAKAHIADATGLLPRQIVLTATHTHCAPFFTPWIMPGAIEPGYAAFLHDKLVEIVIRARAAQVPGTLSFARTTSDFGVNRRLPDGQGGILFAPNPDGPMDRDLDSFFFQNDKGQPLGSLSVFGCHPTSLGGYLIGGDYPGYCCRAIEEATGAPALFATGCAGNIRPWYRREEGRFPRPSFAELEAAGRDLAATVLRSRDDASPIDATPMQVADTFHHLPYTELPTLDALQQARKDDDPRRRDWAAAMLPLAESGNLAMSCPHEIQLVQFNPDLSVVFLGGEVLTEIGLHLKKALQPGLTSTVAYANGLIAYIPGVETYPLGGYEVDDSYHLFLRPAPFAPTVEDLIVAQTTALAASLSG
jgi:neutral ceramidase